VRGSLTELDARLAPVSFLAAESQRQALDRMVGAAVGEIVEAQGIDGFRTESIRLLREEFDRVRADPALPRAVEEDAELDEERAARLILGLQDKPTRDRAAEWVEPGEVPAARRLWRTLARRCVSPYQEHAAAPLTLLGWACWADADDTAARVALNRALRVAPDYGFAALLHQAVNLGLSPEPLFAALRDERRSREREGPAVPAATEPAAPARPTGGVSLERPVRRRLGRRVGRPPGRRPDRGPDRGAGRRAEPPAEHSVRPGPGPCR
jgi:hypothetical protein